MQELTPDLVAQIFQCAPDRAVAVFDQMVATMQDFGITDPAAITCYLVQCDWESGGMQYFTELGDPGYFMRYDINGPDPTLARSLSNLNPGDGYAFRGSGPIQLTGRGNFAAAQAAMDSCGLKGPDGALLDITTLPDVYDGNGHCLKGPDLARTDRYAFATSAWWWQAHGGNDVAQRQPLAYASLCCGRLVNRGDADSPTPAQGEDGRVAAFNRISAFGDLALPAAAPPAPSTSPPPTLLEEIMADPAQQEAFAKQVAAEMVKELLGTQGNRVAQTVDPHTGNITEQQVLVTIRDVLFGGATTMSVRAAGVLNFVKSQAAKIR